MPDDDERSAPPGRPIRLEYADLAAADSAAARGLVYVLAAYGAAVLARVGVTYYQIWFVGRMFYLYDDGPVAWVWHAARAASAAGGVSAVVALVLLLAASRWSCRAAAIAATFLGLGAWLTQAATAYFLAHMPPSTNLGGTGELIVQMLASGGVELLVPPVLLWLFTRRRIAGALAGDAGGAV